MVKDRDFHYLPFIGNALGYGYVLMAGSGFPDG